MGEDVSIPLHKRSPIQPTPENIQRAAKIIGVSEGWLTTGIPETPTDMLVIGHKPVITHITRSAVISDSQYCSITVDKTGDGHKKTAPN